MSGSEMMPPNPCNLNNRECSPYGAKRNTGYLRAVIPDFAGASSELRWLIFTAYLPISKLPR